MKPYPRHFFLLGNKIHVNQKQTFRNVVSWISCFAKWYQKFLSNILRIVEIEGEKETELCNTETGEIGDIEAFVKQKSIEMMADFHGAGKPPHYIGERLPDNSIVSEIFFEDIGNHHSVMA